MEWNGVKIYVEWQNMKIEVIFLILLKGLRCPFFVDANSTYYLEKDLKYCEILVLIVTSIFPEPWN